MASLTHPSTTFHPAAAGAQTKKVLLLGSGAVARPCAQYVVRNPHNALTIGTLPWPHPCGRHGTLTCYNIARRTLKSAEALAADLPNTTAQSLDASFEDPGKQAALEKAVAEHDLVISLVPYTHHVNVIKAAIKGKTNVVTTSYISPGIRELEDEIKSAGIVVLNETGLDPGVDHLYAIKTIDAVHAKGGKVRAYPHIISYIISACDLSRRVHTADQGVPLVLRRPPRARMRRQPP